MSLLFERAIREFSSADARHVRTALDGPAPDADPIRLDYLARLVSNRRDGLAHPDREDWLCVPLHDLGSAELSGEYVAFEQHPVRGQIFVYRDAETGEIESLDPDAVDGTMLARRLRFWLPEFDPDERPSYAREGPWSRVPPTNPIPEGERDAFFDRLAGFVADEREAERQRNRDRARRHTPRNWPNAAWGRSPNSVGSRR